MIKIGVVGAGAMGSGIAQVAATLGHEVFLYDAHPAALQRARSQLEKALRRLVEKEKITVSEFTQILGGIHYTEGFASFREAKLIIEAIVEDLPTKKRVFAQLEDVVEPDCLLATNTSSLSIAAIAAACREPGRVLGIHFFNPAPLMRLVEIIPAVQTTEQTAIQARQWINGWGKTTVVAKDTPGFIVNRIARPFYGEALRILDEGLADAPTIDWAMTKLGGFRMGPFALMDYIGHDVNYKVTETVFESSFYDPRYRPSTTQRRLVEAGFLGRKSGRGFYDYQQGAPLPEPLTEESLGRKIRDRILIMLINEAAEAVYWGVATQEDIELAMTQGVNYPKGPLKWADEIGIRECVRRMDLLHADYLEDRYRCSPLLRRMAREGTNFH